ncbi:folate-binding protein [Egibacter rhizosphaerae]|uniref:Folate-binding protein n=1 Tax=Egibacter rhizosphaerae TaxID=1670831 RepID=A0A411YG44_9ACTN|nr:folate-binding protein YgfZ [Egibacter rhizosphaerae]QBI20244.1 folate-binding protein [Egibacter rhizosphaerae]
MDASPLVDTPAYVRDNTGAVVVTGADRLNYLQSLLSQDAERREAGDVADFLYLDAKGNAKATGRLVVREDDVLLLTPPDVAAPLADELARYTFLLDAPNEDRSADWVIARARGPEPVDGSAVGAPDAPMRARVGVDGVVLRDRSGGIDLAGPAPWVAEAAESLGLPEAEAEDWHRWRIAFGEPAWGAEITTGRRPQELGLLPTHVHLDKGCYPGQESIAKTYNLGRPRRSLCVVEFDAPVTAGAALDAGGKQGEVTSAAPDGAGSIALALVPVDREGALRGEGEVTVDGVSGRVRSRVGEGLPQPGAERQPGSAR